MNSIEASDVTFPIYRLPDDPIVEDGVIFYYSQREDEDGVVTDKIQILDDKNEKGDTLAARRLSLLSKGVNLYALHTAIFFLVDLIKIARGRTTFIDSAGKLFKYKKESYHKLKYYYIDNIIPTQGGGAIICVRGLPQRFKVLHCPTKEMKYAGVLHAGMQIMLYGLYEVEPEKETRKMV